MCLEHQVMILQVHAIGCVRKTHFHKSSHNYARKINIHDFSYLPAHDVFKNSTIVLFL